MTPTTQPTPQPGACAASTEAAASQHSNGAAEAPAAPTISRESRQLRWQKSRLKLGLCRQCGGPKIDKHHCAACAEKMRTSARNRYRLKAGIPLDAPLSNNGRPRIAGSMVQVPSSKFEAAEPATCHLSPSTQLKP